MESGTQHWSHFWLQDVNIIENIQEKFTEFFKGFFKYSYVARLDHLRLKYLEERRIANDVKFLFKIIHRHNFGSTTKVLLPEVFHGS